MTDQPKSMETDPKHTIEVEEQVRKCRHQLEVAFKDFHQLLGDKVLDANKTLSVKKTEEHAINSLYKAAVAMDNANYGEGVMSLAIIAIREMLKMRDRVNELEYTLFLTRKELKESKTNEQEG